MSMTESPRSQFFGQSAEEVAQTYLAWYQRLRLRFVIAAVALGAAARGRSATATWRSPTSRTRAPPTRSGAWPASILGGTAF